MGKGVKASWAWAEGPREEGEIHSKHVTKTPRDSNHGPTLCCIS
jgi:hypothetical protein